MEIDCVHKSLLPYYKLDECGNYPFWIRCSAIESIDGVSDDYIQIKSVFDLVVVRPFTSDVYELKKGYLLLKQNNTWHKYVFGNNFTDYDLQPFIDRNSCYFKECKIILEEEVAFMDNNE